MTTQWPTAELAALLPHMAQMPARLGELLPRILQAIASHSEQMHTLNQELRTRHAQLWAQVRAGAPAPGQQIENPWQDIAYFDFLRKSHALRSQWTDDFVELLELPAPESRRLRFLARQWVDANAPANFAATNPLAIQRALLTQGQSWLRGSTNLRDDLARGQIRMCDESAFEVGRNIATSEGAVIYENQIIQLIQYRPHTSKVQSTPLLMTPPFINKYYILDLTPANSLVGHMLDQGFQVFMISWRNIPPELGHLTWDDYARLGVEVAIDIVLAVTRTRSLHALGFCVGGTLLASALASCVPTQKVASLTLLASLLDFSEVGDIGVYIDEGFVARIESLYATGGVVPGKQVAAAFASLRARELIWKFVVQNYLMGETPVAFDLLYWNSDSAELPGLLFAWYLRNLYLENKLRVPGALNINGQPVDLSRLRMPTFVLGTELDHIVPWHSAFDSAKLLGGKVTFVLGSSGHIAGVVSPPKASRRTYRTGLDRTSSEQWHAGSEVHRGSWWGLWIEWLRGNSPRTKSAPKVLGNRTYTPIEPAPGRYVRGKKAPK